MPRENLLIMGKNGNDYYNKRLSLDVGLKKLNKIYSRIQPNPFPSSLTVQYHEKLEFSPGFWMDLGNSFNS